MIDTKKLRAEHSRDMGFHQTVRDLCDEVDRLRAQVETFKAAVDDIARLYEHRRDTSVGGAADAAYSMRCSLRTLLADNKEGDAFRARYARGGA